MVFLKKYNSGGQKYVSVGPIRMKYRTIITEQSREVFVGPFHFRYWIDEDEGHVWVKVLGARLRFQSNVASRKWKHYTMRDTLTVDKRKELLEEELADQLGYRPNLDNPRTYNEKILWMKLYEENPLITVCCDKYAVKQYVAEHISPDLVVPVLGAWDDPSQIDFDRLPNQFVLKVNWSSGYNIIVKDKRNLDIAEAVRKLTEWMQPHKNSYYSAFNWGYMNMKPVVFAEKYIEQIDGQVYDYKFCMTNGELLYTLIATDRDSNLTKDYFDEQFQHLPVMSGGNPHADPLPQKPKNYDRMLEIARELAKPFLFVRVDFYEVGDSIYLGEMTFYPGGGQLPLEPAEWEYTWGDKIRLTRADTTEQDYVSENQKVSVSL